jgi:soluble lytic murein transglycosylase-like protein
MGMKLRGRVFVVVALATLPLAGWGAERVTLRNGFALTCDHHTQVQNHTRLYLGAGENNFIEFATQEIAAVENVPDAPAPLKDAAAADVAHADDAKLNPADLHEILAHAGAEHNLDIDLLASVVKAESDGNPKAVSRAGARGLMQLMPATANGLGVTDSYKPDQNVRGGSTYLDGLLIRYHDNLALALAAYNAGPEAVDKYHGIPPYHETRVYVARVIHEFNRRVKAREAALKSTKAN